MFVNELTSALKIIGTKFKSLKIDWVIVGSTNLYLRGIPVEPKDIDIVTDENGAKIIQKTLEKFLVKPYHKRLTKINLKFGIKSYAYFSTYEIKSIKVETITKMRIKGKSLNYLREDIDFIEYNGIVLPCLNLKIIEKAYRYGENKDKLELINKYKHNCSIVN